MNPIFIQFIWIVVIIVGAIIVELPEIFKKNEKINRRYRGYFVNIGIVITVAAGLLAALSPQPSVDGVLGIVFIAIGVPLIVLALYLWVVASRPLLKAIGVEQAPKNELVTAGLYNKMRHPIYTGCVVGQIGWAMAWGAVYTLFMMPIFDFLACLAIVKLFEEPMLTRQFGEEYRRYEQTVPQFFPLPYKVGLILLTIAVIVLVFVGLIPIS